MEGQWIGVRGAREHNLQNVTVDIPRDALVVITGLSGSGKSSLAFDTIYAEGQRRYMESLSSYARQFMGMLERPDVDRIEGLSPVIAIEQKTVSRNPRSTVGTVTEVYDFLRLLYARAATSFSSTSGRPLVRQSPEEIAESLFKQPKGVRFSILAPLVKGRKGHYRELFEKISSLGFSKVRVNGKMRTVTPGMRLQRYRVHDIDVVVDRLVIQEGSEGRIRQTVKTALELGGGVLFVQTKGKPDRVFSRHLYDPDTGISYAEASPNTFSFNSPYGWCKECLGWGELDTWVQSLVIPDKSKSLNQGGVFSFGPNVREFTFAWTLLKAVVAHHGGSMDMPIRKLPKRTLRIILDGDPDNVYAIEASHWNQKFNLKYSGVYSYLDHEYEVASSREKRRLDKYRRHAACRECGGGRLNREALSYRIGDHTIADLGNMDLLQLQEFLDTVEFGQRQGTIAGPILKEIKERVSFMVDVGVGYLKLNRPSATLSGGESQRIRLATQIGTQLTGVLYVLDEPSIGLHARDNRKLIRSLQSLRDLGNSVLVVEHDRDMIEAADYVLDLGPGGGEKGGHIVWAGQPSALKEPNGTHHNGVTAQYLSGERCIPVPEVRRTPGRQWLRLHKARGHNLQNVDLQLPVGLLVCVTGVSGSGKSSLINQTLFPALMTKLNRNTERVALPHDKLLGWKYVSKVIDIDQKPIGRTPRSNPATYITLFTLIRNLFANLPESKVRGYKPGRFSFNVIGGRCETCKGGGLVRLEMKFLPDVYVVCESCNGKRYNTETLEIAYKGKTIADVLNMRVDEAAEFFAPVPNIMRKVKTLQSVGLGYVRLGQPSTTISGGEAQRVKLSKELSRPGRGDTVYLLDEPTTGLHFEDIRQLLEVLQALVDKGNTVVVIEHNPDVIKVADHIIDLGPEGGDKGGRILFSGTPEDLAKESGSTAEIMREALGESA